MNAEMLFAAAAKIADDLRITDAKADFKNVELKMLSPSHYVLHLMAKDFNLARVHALLSTLRERGEAQVETEPSDEWPGYVRISLDSIPASALVKMVTFT